MISTISKEIEKITGVQLGSRQASMVQSRLSRRAIDLGLGGLDAYEEYYAEHTAQENKLLISLLTTHHTYFFREFRQFEYLEEKVLPEILPEIKKRADKTLRIWSAACSRGQESYSLAMFLEVALARLAPDVKFMIHGSDIDPESVRIAQNGVYPARELQEAPLHFLRNHWARGTGEIADFVKAKASLTDRCTFGTLNLFSPQTAFPQERFDVIFCRNVFIYFTPAQILEVMGKLGRCLTPHGYVFLGVSESLANQSSPFETAGPSVYRPRRPKPAPAKAATKETAPAPQPKPQPKRPLRVFSIDDSPTVHSLIKKICSEDPDFEFVGSAMNGKEAGEKLASFKADVVTLDIHMPEMDGIEYLKRFFKVGHPPVVMVSSVSRDDHDLAYQALRLGASDYVEKPALANLADRGEEIRAKLKSAFEAGKNDVRAVLELDKAFAKDGKISKPERTAVFAVGTMAQATAWEKFRRHWSTGMPASYFFVEGAGNALPAIAKKIGASVWVPGSAPLKPGETAVADLKTAIAELAKAHEKIVIVVFGRVSGKAEKLLRGLRSDGLLVEDPGPDAARPALADVASDLVPATSFPYLCWKALAD